MVHQHMASGHRSFQNSIAFIRVSCFSNPQLYASYISIFIFEYLNHPCHGPPIASTFIMQYQNNITNTEISFSTLPFCTWLKWLKILFSPMWQNSLAVYWTQQRHLFQQYKSGLLKFTGGDITSFDFTVRMFDRAWDKSLVGLLMVSIVNGVNSGFLLFHLLVSAEILCQVIFCVLKEGRTVLHEQI